VEIDQDGRIYLVKRYDMGNGETVESLVFQAQVMKDGQVFTERDAQWNPGVIERVRPFRVQAGRSEVREGKVISPKPEPTINQCEESPMSSKFIALALIPIATLPLAAQKIESESGDRNRIVHLETALNHLTIIEVSEPVMMVAAGSPSFKVEWKENKVFVQPTEADVATNLFIWTASERLNYELEPAGAIEKMDFVMDFVIDETPRMTQSRAAPPPPPPAPAISPTEVLLGGKPVRMEAAKHTKKPVEVLIRDLYEENGKLLIRYAVRNQGERGYDLGTPAVYTLDGARYPQSLYTLENSQLGEQEASHLKVKRQILIPVLHGQLQTSHLDPGQEAIGIVAFRLPPTNEPRVLRLQFPKDATSDISAYLVR